MGGLIGAGVMTGINKLLLLFLSFRAALSFGSCTDDGPLTTGITRLKFSLPVLLLLCGNGNQDSKQTLPSGITAPMTTGTTDPLALLNVFCVWIFIGWARTINYTYIRYTYGIFSREITIHTVMHGVYIQFWPTLDI